MIGIYFFGIYDLTIPKRTPVDQTVTQENCKQRQDEKAAVVHIL